MNVHPVAVQSADPFLIAENFCERAGAFLDGVPVVAARAGILTMRDSVYDAT